MEKNKNNCQWLWDICYKMTLKIWLQFVFKGNVKKIFFLHVCKSKPLQITKDVPWLNFTSAKTLDRSRYDYCGNSTLRICTVETCKFRYLLSPISLPISCHLENANPRQSFCHLVWAQCLLWLLLLSTYFGLHLSWFLTVVSIICDLSHQPTSTVNANPTEFHLQFLDF